MAARGPGPPVRDKTQFPDLCPTHLKLSEDEPRFVKIKGYLDGSLKEISPFLIAKNVETVAGKCLQSWMERVSGHMCVQVKNALAAERLLKLKHLQNSSGESIPIEIVNCDYLNQSKVMIYCENIVYETEKDIMEALAAQKVVGVRRITKLVDGRLRNTPLLILTIDSVTVPDYMKVGLLRVKTRPYYPKPMRCFNCLQFGHIKDKCKDSKICQNCAGPFHGDECEEPSKCACCGKQHGTLSRDCLITQEQHEICKIKAIQRVSFPEARRIYESTVNKRSYAETTKTDMEKLMKRMDELEKIVREQAKQLFEKDLVITKQAGQIEELTEKLRREMQNKAPMITLNKSAYEPSSSDMDEDSELVSATEGDKEEDYERDVTSQKRKVQISDGDQEREESDGNRQTRHQDTVQQSSTSSSSSANVIASRNKISKMEGHSQNGATRGGRLVKPKRK